MQPFTQRLHSRLVQLRMGQRAPQRGLVGGLADAERFRGVDQVQAGDQAQQQRGARPGRQLGQRDPGAADTISIGWRSRLVQNWMGQVPSARVWAWSRKSRRPRASACSATASLPHWLRTKTQARTSMPRRNATRVERRGGSEASGRSGVTPHSSHAGRGAVDLTDADLLLRQTGRGFARGTLCTASRRTLKNSLNGSQQGFLPAACHVSYCICSDMTGWLKNRQGVKKHGFNRGSASMRQRWSTELSTDRVDKGLSLFPSWAYEMFL
jgi:hypothetical protein